MTELEFFVALYSAATLSDALVALDGYLRDASGTAWSPVGDRDNNRGIIEVSSDPGRALIERVTNGIDAILEAEHGAHNGLPLCKSPREAAAAWLNIPTGGLSQMTPAQRRELARRVTLTVLPGDTKEARILEVRDLGIGLSRDEIPKTILSLNEANKMTKHYLAGAYGQGGSSTYAASALTFIASRPKDCDEIAFTVVKFRDLPPDQYKTGHYVYLVRDRRVMATPLGSLDFSAGTLVKHFGYDLSGYDGSLGPGSVYGLLNQTLFDPVIPVWLDHRVRNYRRVIKGSRNALNGAVDDGDAGPGPSLSHRMPMLYVPVREYGRIGIEYWVLEATTKRPTAAFANPSRPILLTLSGQAQAELPVSLVKKDAELPYLAQRLICHVDCNSLTPSGLRLLFVSNREVARSGTLLHAIRSEIINALRSDDELTRLNSEARNATLKDRDESAVIEARKIVAKLLKLQGSDIPEVTTGAASEVEGVASTKNPASRPRRPRALPESIELHNPPTYIKILWDESDIPFYPEQRRYIRIETDAESSYHDPTDPHSSRLNVIVSNGEVAFRASSALQGGRMRAVVDCMPSAQTGGKGTFRVELSRPGLSMLSDEREFTIVQAPATKEERKQVSLPPFDYQPVRHGDETWTTLDWPDDIGAVASAAVDEKGTHMVYYNADFPPFRSRFETFERKSPALADSFSKRYAIWIVVHSLLHLYQDRAREELESLENQEDDEQRRDSFERSERIRVATLSAMIAAREMQLSEAGMMTDADDV